MHKGKRRRAVQRLIARKVRTQFLIGLVVTIPIGVTIFILALIFRTIDNILQPIIRSIWGINVPGIGFAAMIILIYLIGIIADNIVGKKLIHYGESLVARIPLVRQIYRGIKQVLQSFSSPGKTGFMQVVLAEFPHKGMRAIGFVTNEVTNKSGERILSVLIPTSPNPTTGFLQIVKETDVIRTKLSVDDALKMIVSAGRMTPEEMSNTLTSQYDIKK